MQDDPTLMGVTFVSLSLPWGPGEPQPVVCGCVGVSLQRVLCVLSLVPSLCEIRWWHSARGCVPHVRVKAVSAVVRRSPAPCAACPPSSAVCVPTCTLSLFLLHLV